MVYLIESYYFSEIIYEIDMILPSHFFQAFSVLGLKKFFL